MIHSWNPNPQEVLDLLVSEATKCKTPAPSVFETVLKRICGPVGNDVFKAIVKILGGK